MDRTEIALSLAKEVLAKAAIGPLRSPEDVMRYAGTAAKVYIGIYAEVRAADTDKVEGAGPGISGIR